MGGVIEMKKHRAVLLGFCSGIVIIAVMLLAVKLISVGQGREAASLFSNVPKWIKGKLVLSTVGSLNLCDAGEFPPLQSVCLFDFDNRDESSLLTGLDTMLIQDFNDDDIFLVEKYHDGNSDVTESHSSFYGHGSDYMFRELKYSTEKRVLSADSNYIKEMGFIDTGDANIGIAGIDRGDNFDKEVFYWRYANDSENEWEAELAAKKWIWASGSTEPRACFSRSLREREYTQIAISKDGIVAYTGDYGSELYCLDDQSVKKLADEQCETAVFCWIDETRFSTRPVPGPAIRWESPTNMCFGFGIRIQASLKIIRRMIAVKQFH